MEEENRKLREELKAQKAASWGTIMSWRNRFSKTQEALQAEIDARDKQLRDIAASLILLESQLQKERKRMATEIAEKEETIKKLERQNRRLSDLNGEISSRVFSANKPSPSENFEDRPRADRRARRAVSEDRHTGRQSHSSSSRERSSRKPKAAQSGQVVIERRSREKRVEKNLHSDSSEEDATKMKKSPLERRRVTRSMRGESPTTVKAAHASRLHTKINRGGSSSSGCSSDEPSDYPLASVSRHSKMKSSTLPARCDPTLLNQWAKNELEQGIII